MEALNYIADGTPPTTWRTIISSVFYYSTLPIAISFRTITSILLAIFSPLIYLGAFFSRIALYPFSLLWKLETLYIYLGIASFIGLLTGAVLYFFSEMLITMFSLDKPAPPLFGKSVYGGKSLRDWSGSTRAISEKTERDESIPWYSGNLRKQNLELLSRRRGLDGLRSQVILEEDSDGSHL